MSKKQSTWWKWHYLIIASMNNIKKLKLCYQLWKLWVYWDDSEF